MVLTLSMVLIFQLAYSSKLELRMAKNSRDEDRIYYALRGAVLKAEAILRNDATRTQGGSVDSLQEEWAAGPLTESFGEVQVDIRIEDEERRFNLLHLTALGSKAKEKEFIKKARETLESILVDFRSGTDGEISASVARELVRKMEAWVNRGARDRIPPAPTESGNKMLTLDELLLLEDDEISPYLLYDQWDAESEVLIPGLSRYVTLWSNGLVNINTADLVVLRGLLSERNREHAEAIIEYRGDLEEGVTDARRVDKDRAEDEANTGIFEQVQDLTGNNVIPADAFAEIENLVDVSSQVFSVWVTAKQGKIRKCVRVLFRREGSKLFTILWEERPDLRIPDEGPYAEEEDQEKSFFGLTSPLPFPSR